MANFTPNYNLRKPVGTEQFDIDRDFNANWDVIDGELKEQETIIANLEIDELTRETNETARKAAESGRVTAEQGRTTAESGRVTAESSRVTAEGARVSAESSRLTAESARVTAESNRAAVLAAKAEKTYVDTELAKKADKVQEAWITPTLLNGWTHGTVPVRYFKDSLGTVHIVGNIVFTGVAAYATIFQLPEGYRPPGSRQIVCATHTATGFEKAAITVDGDVYLDVSKTGGGYVFLNFMFRAV